MPIEFRRPSGFTFARLLAAPAALSTILMLTASARAEPPSVPLDPDGTLKFDGQFRPRLLVSSGRDFLGEVSAREYVTQRARLGLTFEQDSGLAFTMRVQDVRIWGEETDTLNDFSADGFDVHEAFALIPAADWLALRVGRQELILDDARLVGNVGWSQRGRSFDAVRGTFDFDPLTLDIFYAKVREAESYADGHVADEVEDDIDFGGVHTSVVLAKGHAVSSLYLINANHGFNDSGDEHLRHTAGLFAKGGVGGFSYQAEGYYQFGRISDARIAAYMGAARLGYQLDVPGKPSALLWGEYLSGDGTPGGTFDTLYATNHKFYGEMDFFLSIPANTALLGLVDLGGQLGASASEDVKLNADFHHLRSAESSQAGDNVFGNEIDFKVQWAAMEHVAVRALYGIFLPGDAIRAPKKYSQEVELKPEHLGYLTLDVTL